MGGWKENAFVFRFEQLCKMLSISKPLKEFWSSLIESMIGEPLHLCPIAAVRIGKEN